MIHAETILKEMWARQQISDLDVDYAFWEQRKDRIRQLSRMNRSCLFTVDVFKCRYDFASDNFADIFGYDLSRIKEIDRQGDLLEEKIHPDDKVRMNDIRIKHSQFIYSLPIEKRNDYTNTYQFRMLNAKEKYINVISRQQVIQTDRNGKAWMISGTMDISPDQAISDHVKYTVFDSKTGEFVTNFVLSGTKTILTEREIEILRLIRSGFLSKEIAYKLHLSIHTVNNHRKNILLKLRADNSIEALNNAEEKGLLH